MATQESGLLMSGQDDPDDDQWDIGDAEDNTKRFFGKAKFDILFQRKIVSHINYNSIKRVSE